MLSQGPVFRCDTWQRAWVSDSGANMKHPPSRSNLHMRVVLICQRWQWLKRSHTVVYLCRGVMSCNRGTTVKSCWRCFIQLLHVAFVSISPTRKTGVIRVCDKRRHAWGKSVFSSARDFDPGSCGPEDKIVMDIQLDALPGASGKKC